MDYFYTHSLSIIKTGSVEVSLYLTLRLNSSFMLSFLTSYPLKDCCKKGRGYELLGDSDWFIYTDSLECWERISNASGIWTYFKAIGIRFARVMLLFLGLLLLSAFVNYSNKAKVSNYSLTNYLARILSLYSM
jgi:hypothetical protein